MQSYRQEMKKPWRCVLRLHDWRKKSSDEGHRFEICNRCGAYRDKIHLGDHPGQ